MFGVDSSEFLIILVVAVVVIGPKELPRVMRTVGQWVGKARGMANQFRSGVDQMVRDSEIAELEQKWREQNEAIMKAHPMAPADTDWGLPEPVAPVSIDKGSVAPPNLAKSSPASAPALPSPTMMTKKRRPAAPKPIAPSYPTPRTGDEA